MSMTTTLTANLLSVANLYLSQRPQAWSTLGKVALRDPKFFTRLQSPEAGKMTTQAYDRAMQFFSDCWPPGLVWPAAVPRPAVVDARQQTIKPRKRSGLVRYAGQE